MTHPFILVKYSNTTIIAFIVGIWYKEDRIFDLVNKSLANINPTSLSSDLSNAVIGKYITKELRLLELYVKYIDKSDVAKFAKHDKLLYWELRTTAYNRIYNDIGRKVKQSSWWKNNIKAIKLDKRRMRILKKVMSD